MGQLPNDLFSQLGFLRDLTLTLLLQRDKLNVAQMLSSINPNNISSITIIVPECRSTVGFRGQWMEIDTAMMRLRLGQRPHQGDKLVLEIYFESKRLVGKISKIVGRDPYYVEGEH